MTCRLTRKAGRRTLAVICAAALAAGCGKAPVDGDIEGFWRLEQFVTHKDGQTHPCRRLYYSIQHPAVEVSEKQGPNGYRTSIGRFGYGAGRKTVRMEDFYYRSSTGDGGKPSSPDDLRPYGLFEAATDFDVLKADGRTLVLRSDSATLTLKSF